MTAAVPYAPDRMLLAAARHIQAAGLYVPRNADDYTSGGGTRGGAPLPCSVDLAWDRGQAALRPGYYVPGSLWGPYHEGRRDSLQALAEEADVRPVPDWWNADRDGWLRSSLWNWGTAPGRTTPEAVELFRRAAARVSA